MPESPGSLSNPPDSERTIVVRYQSDAKARGRGAVRWLRNSVAAFEATLGATMGYISIRVSISPPPQESRPMWVTVSAICAVLFVVFVVIRSVLDNRDKTAEATRHEAEVREQSERHAAQMKAINDAHSLLIRFIEEPKISAAPIAAINEPDVSLRFELPNGFELHNYGGDATDVSIAPVTIAEYISNDWGNFPIKTAEQTVRFPIVDIDSGKSKQILPTHTYLGVPLPTTMEKFFEAFITRRRVEVLGLPERAFPEPESPPEKIEAYMRESARLRNEPVDIEMKLVFSNRKTGRGWERIETLHYEPATREARVIHGKPREVIG